MAYCKKIRKARHIAYDAIAVGTAYLKIDDGIIKFIDGYDSQYVVMADDRWTGSVFDKYVELLNDFYHVTDFKRFYTVHRPLYQRAENMMDSIVANKINSGWFNDFYGESVDFSIFISLNNGFNNYGLTSELPEHNRGMLVGGLSEYNGRLMYNRSVVDVVIHELTHTFANPIVRQYETEMSKTAAKAFRDNQQIFMKYGVGIESIPYEWLTRLFVLCYMRDNEKAFQEYQHSDIQHYRLKLRIFNEYDKGFFWMPRSFGFMQNFYNHRDKYPTIKEFVPQLVAFYNYVINNEHNRITKEVECLVPHVVNIYPVPGSKLDLTQDSLRIEVTFSRDMNTDAQGIGYLQSNIVDNEKYEVFLMMMMMNRTIRRDLFGRIRERM